MSLINDALNRARADAARGEAETTPTSSMPTARSERTSGSRAAAWLAVGVLAIAGVLWLWPRADRSTPPTERPQATAPSSTEATPTATASEPAISPAAELDETPAPNRSRPPADIEAPSPPAPAIPEAVAVRAAVPAEPSAGETVGSTVPDPGPTDAPRDESASSASTTLAAVEPPSTSTTEVAAGPSTIWPASGEAAETWYYVGRFTPAGSAPIELSGIAWSANAPSAMLNGALLGVGDEILGWNIAEIGPRTVVLSGQGQRIALQLGASTEP